MIEVKAIDHIVLRTSHREAMLYFYQQVLGCAVERELRELGLTQLRAGDSLIDLVDVDSELGLLGGQAPQQDGRNLEHFCLQVAPFDEQALIDYLTQHRIRISEFATRYGAQGFGRSAYIEDPEGNIVELKPRM